MAAARAATLPALGAVVLGLAAPSTSHVQYTLPLLSVILLAVSVLLFSVQLQFFIDMPNLNQPVQRLSGVVIIILSIICSSDMTFLAITRLHASLARAARGVITRLQRSKITAHTAHRARHALIRTAALNRHMLFVLLEISPTSRCAPQRAIARRHTPPRGAFARLPRPRPARRTHGPVRVRCVAFLPARPTPIAGACRRRIHIHARCRKHTRQFPSLPFSHPGGDAF